MADTKIAQLTPGSTFAGHFEILEKLGSGGMGSVYKARNVLLDNVVALKVMQAVPHDDQNARQRFKREGQAVSALRHLNIVSVHTFGMDGDDCFMSMDFLDGRPLSDLLEERGRLSVAEAIAIALQAAAGLAHAHDNGIVHRDVKPSNIMLVNDNGSTLVKIVDFGVAKLLDETGDSSQKLTKTNAMIGTPLYMSPEQCDRQPVDGRSDIYSLGCVLYQLLSGRPPFQDESLFAVMYSHVHSEPAALPGDVPAWLSAVVAGMMKKTPADRFQSMNEVAECFRNSWAPNVVTTEGEKTRKRPLIGKTILAAFGLATVVTAGIWLFQDQFSPARRWQSQLAIAQGQGDFEKQSDVEYAMAINLKADSEDNFEQSVRHLVQAERKIKEGDEARAALQKWVLLTKARDRIAEYRKSHNPAVERWAPLVFVVSQAMLDVSKNVGKQSVTDWELAKDWLNAAEQSNDAIEKAYAYNALLAACSAEERSKIIADAARSLDAIDLSKPGQLGELNSDPRRGRLLEAARRIAHGMQPFDSAESHRLFVVARQLSERLFPGSSQPALVDYSQAQALTGDGKTAEAAKVAARALPIFEANIPRGNDNAMYAIDCLKMMLPEAKTASERQKILQLKSKLEAERRGTDG